MAGEEREVVARLKIQKEGDDDAFQQAVSDLEELAGVGPKAAEAAQELASATSAAAGGAAELGSAAATAAPAVETLGGSAQRAAASTGELTSAQREAKGIMDEWGLGAEQAAEAGEAVSESNREIGESATGTGGKLVDLAGKATLVFAAFKTGYELGKQLREGLNDLTDGGLDRAVQGFIDFHLRAIDADRSSEELAANTQRLANNIRILKANGIDPTNLSLAEMDKLVEQVSRAKREAAIAAEELAEAEEEWAASLGLSEKALSESAKLIVDRIKGFADANKQLSDQDLGEIFKEQLQQLLDGFERLGKEAPLPLQDLARQFGVLSSSVEKDAQKTSQAVESMYNSIVGESKSFAGSLEKQAEVIRESFAKLTPKDLSFGSEGFERAKAILQQYVDESRKAGVQIPKDIADQAAALGVLVAAMEVAGGGATSFAASQKEAQTETVRSTQVFTAQGKELHGLEAAAATAGTGVKQMGSAIREGAGLVAQAGPPLQETKRSAEELQEGFRRLGTDGKLAGEQVKEAAAAAKEGSSGLADAAAAGESAGKGLATAKEGAAGLGRAAREGKGDVEGMSESLKGLLDSIPSIGEAFKNLSTLKLSGTRAEVAGLTSDLQALETQAKRTKVALDEVDGEANS